MVTRFFADFGAPEFGGLVMSVMNGLYDLGGFGPTELKKQSCPCDDYPDYSLDESHIQAPRVRRNSLTGCWVAVLDLENRSPSLSRGIKDFMLESFEPSGL